MYILYFV